MQEIVQEIFGEKGIHNMWSNIALHCYMLYTFKCSQPTSMFRKNVVETLIDTSMEVGLEVNAEESKYMLLSCH
jgi:hypothetical protein